MFITMRILPIFICVLSLGLSSPIATNDELQNMGSSRSSDSSSGRLPNQPSIFTLLNSPQQRSQLFDVLQDLLSLNETTLEALTRVDDSESSSTRKSDGLTQFSVDEEITEMRPDAVDFILNATAGVFQDILNDPAIANDINQTVDVIKKMLPNGNKMIANGAVSLGTIETLRRFGIIQPENFYDWLNYFLTSMEMPISSEDRDRIIASSVLALLSNGRSRTVSDPYYIILRKVDNFLPNVNNAISQGSMSFVSSKTLGNYGRNKPQQSPDFLSYFYDALRSLDGSRSQNRPVPKSFESTTITGTNNRQAALKFDKTNPVKVQDKGSFGSEVSKSIPINRFASGVPIKNKRSTNEDRESLYSTLLDGMTKLPSLDTGMRIMASPNSKQDYKNLINFINTFVNIPKLSDLSKAVDDTFDYMTPEKLIEVFANAFEQMLESEDRLATDNYKEEYYKYMEEVADAAAWMDPSYNFLTQAGTIGLTMYGMLLNEGLGSPRTLENFTTNLISEMYAMSGVPKPEIHEVNSADLKTLPGVENSLQFEGNYV